MYTRSSWSRALPAAGLALGCAAGPAGLGAAAPKAEPCAEGSFLGLHPHEPVVWVDPARGDDGAAGDEAGPLRSLAEALRRAPGGTVLLLPGAYTEALSLGAEHDGLVLAGACAEAVEWSGAAEEGALVTVEGPAEVGWELRGLSLLDAPVGLRARGGALRLRDVVVRGHRDFGLYLDSPEAGAGTLDAEDLRVEAPPPESPGMGLVSAGGYDVQLRRATFLGNHNLGIAFQSTLGGRPDHVVLEGVEVEDTTPWPEGPAAALFLGGGTATTATDVGLFNTVGRGLYLGSLDEAPVVATVQGLVVAGNTGPPLDDLGSGVSVVGAATLRCEDCELRDNTWAGLYATGHAEVYLEGDSWIRGTRIDTNGVANAGLSADAGAFVAATGLRVVGNASRSVYAGPGAHVELRGGRVEAGEPDAAGMALGLVAAGGSLDAWGVVVQDHVGAGALVLDDEGGAQGRMLLANGCVVEGVGPGSYGAGGGVYVLQGGEAHLDGCVVRAVGSVGVVAEGEGSQLDATDLAVQDVTEGDAGAWGVVIGGAATGAVEGLFVEAVPGYGVLVLDASTLELSDATLLDLPAPRAGESVPALLVEQDSRAEVRGLVVEGATGIAVSSRRGSALVVEDLEVRELAPDPGGAVNGTSPAAGVGVELVGGGSLELRRARIEGAPGMGVYVADPSSATLEDVQIVGTRHPDEFSDAWALVLLDPSVVSLSGVELRETRGVGLWVGEATVVSEAVTVVDTTRSASGQPALGAVFTSGAAGHLDGLEVREVAGPGLSVFGGATLSCVGCFVHEARYAGAQVYDASLVLEGGSVEATRPDDSGLGGGVGVLAADGGQGAARLELWGAAVGAHPLAAVIVAGDGAWRLEGAELGSEADDGSTFGPWGQALFAWGWEELRVAGPRAWDGARGLRVQDCVVEGPNPEPVLLVGADAEWCGNTLPEGAAPRATHPDPALTGCDAAEAVLAEDAVLFEPLFPQTRYDEPGIGTSVGASAPESGF